jgi:hypothetical protein
MIPFDTAHNAITFLKKGLKVYKANPKKPEDMKEEQAVGIILVAGLAVSLLTRSYIGVALAAFGIPLYLAYLAREQNILVKARLVDRDLFVMIGVTVVVILVFNTFSDPRLGLVGMAFIIPLIFLFAERLNPREESE